MKTRVFSLLVVLALLVSIVPAISAQGDDTLTCFNLAEEDCTILLAATANSENINSFAMDYSVAVSLIGLEAIGPMLGETGGDTVIDVKGDGTFTMVEDVFPPIAMETSLDASMTGAENQSGSMSIVIADGFAYFRDSETETWLGQSIVEAMNSPEIAGLLGGFLGEGDLSDLPSGALSPEGLLGSDMAGMLESAGMSDVMGMLQIPGFINHVREADVDMMGQNMHVFKLTLDSAPLFESPEFQSLLTNALTAAAAEDPDMASFGMLLPMLLDGTSITLEQTQYVGADDMFIHGLGLDLVATLDMSALMTTSGSSGSDMQMPPITLEVHFEVTLDQINESFEIMAPEGATIISQ